MWYVGVSCLPHLTVVSFPCKCNCLLHLPSQIQYPSRITAANHIDWQHQVQVETVNLFMIKYGIPCDVYTIQNERSCSKYTRCIDVNNKMLWKIGLSVHFQVQNINRGGLNSATFSLNSRNHQAYYYGRPNEQTSA